MCSTPSPTTISCHTGFFPTLIFTILVNLLVLEASKLGCSLVLVFPPPLLYFIQSINKAELFYLHSMSLTSVLLAICIAITLAGVSNLLVSLGHTRRVVLDHIVNML